MSVGTHTDQAPARPIRRLKRLVRLRQFWRGLLAGVSSWLTRRAYQDAFTRSDPVVLIIKTSSCGPRDYQADSLTATDVLVHEILAEYPAPAQVRCLHQELTSEQMRVLHHLGDGYVSLTHSEGWGLGAFEAAALGKPVIMTGWGGQLEYLTSEQAFLIDYDLIPVQDRLGQASYHSPQQWAQPDRTSAARWLRWVFEHPRQAREKAAPLSRRIPDRFGATAVTQKLLAAIDHA